jgi:formylmethanofuran dehydrogenase subunit E
LKSDLTKVNTHSATDNIQKVKNAMNTELMPIIKRAANFHGHLGPFLVIGIRMGLVGIRELKTKATQENLHVTARLKYSVPFSCVLDGIQITTRCTFGNQKLTLKNSPDIAAEFQLPDTQQVTVAVNQTTFNDLQKQLLSKNPSNHEVEELARLIASMPEKDLFVIKKE